MADEMTTAAPAGESAPAPETPEQALAAAETVLVEAEQAVAAEAAAEAAPQPPPEPHRPWVSI